jgi:hypothetical protein
MSSREVVRRTDHSATTQRGGGSEHLTSTPCRSWEDPLGGKAAEWPNAGAMLPAMNDPERA